MNKTQFLEALGSDNRYVREALADDMVMWESFSAENASPDDAEVVCAGLRMAVTTGSLMPMRWMLERAQLHILKVAAYREFLELGARNQTYGQFVDSDSSEVGRLMRGETE